MQEVHNRNAVPSLWNYRTLIGRKLHSFKKTTADYLKVKRDNTVETAIHAPAFSNARVKNHYQFWGKDHSFDLVAEPNNRRSREVWSISFGMFYVYGDVALDNKTTQNCDCQRINVKTTESYRFTNGRWWFNKNSKGIWVCFVWTFNDISYTYAFTEDDKKKEQVHKTDIWIKCELTRTDRMKQKSAWNCPKEKLMKAVLVRLAFNSRAPMWNL